MNRSLLLSVLATLLLIFVMRWQGQELITPISPKGILDLEFARTPERLQQIRLFWDNRVLQSNIYLDFLFIAAYVWFFAAACRSVARRTGWEKAAAIFMGLGVAAGLFDVCENFLMLLVWWGRFDPGLMQAVYYCAVIKFILAAACLLFLLMALPFALRKRNVAKAT